jgi:hypothetical protein
MITETRVRKGESTEALCFSHEYHPRSEIVAQNSCVFWSTPRRTFTIGACDTQERAETVARFIAPMILQSMNPYKAAVEMSKTVKENTVQL